ncbi:MAG TPA: aminopeptidase P N-terminal domain-containing protein [Mycobacteriales bacterium]|nr:aminopeptidase P N-terminal domain-containing protein [Mycobacteriales bacterium]
MAVAWSDEQLQELISSVDVRRRVSVEFLRAMTEGWSQPAAEPKEWLGAAPRQARRAGIAADFPGEQLVVPVGRAPRRTNDLYYSFRPATDFMWLVGEADQGSVLVIGPDGHAVLHVDERPPYGDPRALMDQVRGAVWDGPSTPLAAVGAQLGLDVRPIADLEPALRAAPRSRAVRGFDPVVDAIVPDDGQELEKQLARRRLVKEPYEIAELRDAADASIEGFEAVARVLPEAIKHGQPFVEGLFTSVARTRGRGVSYNPVCGGGADATVLHWFRNDGPVPPDGLLLLDAGVEGRELYSSDVTRTIPVSGRYSPAQRDVHDVVSAAHRAAVDLVRPGVAYGEPGLAAAAVLRDGLRSLGVLPHPALERLDEADLQRRWSLHAVGHMLGIDVHDCAVVAEEYYEAKLEVGNVLTIEPGLYFSPYDEYAPEHLRGIGVRIEDDVVVTEDGNDVISSALPTTSDGMEAWLAAPGARSTDSTA